MTSEYGDYHELPMYEEYLLRLKRRKYFYEELEFHNNPIRKLERHCNLNVFQQAKSWRSTKLMCEIGDITGNNESLLNMMRHGMDVAVVNITSLGFQKSSEMIRLIRDVSHTFYKEEQKQIGIAVNIDIPAAYINKITLEDGSQEIKEGASVWLVSNEENIQDYMENVMLLDVSEYPIMLMFLLERSRLFIDSSITIIVRENYGNYIRCLVEQGGKVDHRAKLDFIWSQNLIYNYKYEYLKQLEFVNENDCDFALVSFIKDQNSFSKVKSILKNDIGLMVKIETPLDEQSLNDVIEHSTGVMISRYRLSLELSIEKAYTIQQKVIALCLTKLKPVVMGYYQLPDSMTAKSRPFIAEYNDLANVVLSNVDAVLLADQIDSGLHILESIEAASKICLEAETTQENYNLTEQLIRNLKEKESVAASHTVQVCITAVTTAFKSKAKALIVLTKSGRSAAISAALHPDCVIIAISKQLSAIRQCAIYRNVEALWYDGTSDSDTTKQQNNELKFALQWAKSNNLLHIDDKIIFLCDTNENKNPSKSLRILVVPDDKIDLQITFNK